MGTFYAISAAVLAMSMLMAMAIIPRAWAAARKAA